MLALSAWTSALLKCDYILWLAQKACDKKREQSYCFFFSCILGKFNAKWLSSDFSFCWGPRCHPGSSQQRGPSSYGKRRQSSSQTGAGESHGRVEILNLFRLLGLSAIKEDQGEAWSASWNKDSIVKKISFPSRNLAKHANNSSPPDRLP